MASSTIELKFYRREDVPSHYIGQAPIAQVAQSLSYPANEWWEKDVRRRCGFLFREKVSGTEVAGDVRVMLRKALDMQQEIDAKLGMHDIELKVLLYTGRTARRGFKLDNRTLQLLIQLGASFDIDIY